MKKACLMMVLAAQFALVAEMPFIDIRKPEISWGLSPKFRDFGHEMCERVIFVPEFFT